MPVIFQGRPGDSSNVRRDREQENECERDVEENAIPRPIGQESEIFRTARSPLANVRRWGSPGGVKRCAWAHAGGPLHYSLGVPLGVEGPWNSFA